jgi:2Fe-2S ferredoxin
VPRVVYVQHNGLERRIDVPEGKSIMRGAVENNVKGIEAICGGECACGTCHVYVDSEYLDKLAPPHPDEDALLDCVAAERKVNSRLSCQIAMRSELDGIVVRLPSAQS